MQVALLDINETAGKKLMDALKEQYGEEKILFRKCNVESEEMLRGFPLPLTHIGI